MRAMNARMFAAVACAAASFAVASCSKDDASQGEGTAAPPRAADHPVAGDDAAPSGHPPMGSPHGGYGGAEVSVTVDGDVADFGAFRADVPEGWAYSEPSSQMRIAEFALPGAEGSEDAELVVFYMGEGGAGGVQANLQRWIGQFESDEEPEVAEGAVAGMAVTTVDVSGRYVAPVTPGAAEMHDEPNYRMIASIIETPRGPFYFRMLGDAETLAAHADDAEAMLATIETAE